MNVCSTSKVALLGWPERDLSVCPDGVPAAVLVLTLLYVLTFLVSIISNGMLMCALWQTSRSLQCRSYIVVSQSASDLLVTLVCVPDTVLSRLTPRWLLGEAWCRASPPLHVLAVAASTCSLMMLSMDRCLAMKSPKMFNQGARSRLAAKLTAAVWTVAATISAPLLFAFRLVPGPSGPVCQERWSWPLAGRAYHAVLLLLVVVAPCAVVAVCHTMVSRNLRSANSLASISGGAGGQAPPPGGVIIMSRQARAGALAPRLLQRTDSGDEAATSGPRASASSPARCSSTWRPFQRQREQCGGASRSRPPLLRSTSSYSLRARQQLANVLVILVVAFAACWLPFTLAGLTHLLYANRVTSAVLPFALLLGHAHSAVNPIVYSLIHRSSLTQVQRSLPRPRLGGGARWRRAVARFRRPPPQPPSPVSSTNLGNLGAFHPRFLPDRNMLHPGPAIAEDGRTSHFFH